MAERIADMGIVASTVPNTAMMLSGGLRDTTRKPADIKPIALHRIEIVDRERPVDKARVAELAASIRREGLLQPIGVRRSAVSGGSYRLVYGAHRLEAGRMIAADDPTQDAIAAVIFPPNMPDWACKMAEIAENVQRKELSVKQREAQTTIYAGLLKKHGQVKSAGEISGYNRSKKIEPHHAALSPTVTQQVAKDLGVSHDTVQRRVANAVKTAERVGVAVEHKTPETMSGDELIRVGEAAERAPDSARSPTYPQGGMVSTDLDPTDPAPFIAWCRKRLDGHHKPMSLEMLRAYRKALDDLIREYEAKP